MMPSAAANREMARYVLTHDSFLPEDERFERQYRRRKQQFLTRQDVSNERLFLISDQKPWQVFLNGYTRLQRRQLIFEHSSNFPALHQSCINGNREQFQLLLHSVCVLEQDTCGRTALHHSVITEHLTIAKKLLRRRDAKLQVHVQDNSSRSALHYALEKLETLALHRPQGSRVPALVTAEMRTESKRYRRLWEVADRMFEMVNRRVLDEGNAGGEDLKVLDFRCRGGLWDVCRTGDLVRLESIVKIYGCPEEEWQLRELKWTLLHEACENQQLPVVYFLIATVGLSVSVQDVSGCTALHCAARRGYLDVCQVLLDKSSMGCGDKGNEVAEDLALIQDVRGRTTLHWCLLGSADSLPRLQVATFLAQACTPALHVCDEDGVYPLHLAIWRGELELVQLFICLGANVCAHPISQLRHDEDVEKAAWAPCGIVFQRRRLKKLKKAAVAIALSDEVSNSPLTRSKKSTPDWENVQHPVELLWYWQSSGRYCVSDSKMSGNEKQQSSNNNIVIAEEELGCRKYGGICERCKLSSSTETRAISPDESCCNHHMLSPLLLSIRVCRLKHDGTTSDHQVAVVDLLLESGADPDGVCKSEDASCESIQMNVQVPTSLIEGLMASFRYPQILPMLLKHGAKQIRIHDIVRSCLTTHSTQSNKVEALLNQLLELRDIATNPEFLVMIFGQKYFHTLRNCVELWTRNIESSDDAEEINEGKQRSESPWSCIYETLVALSKRRRYPEVVVIDVDHLEFLYGLIQPGCETTRHEGDPHERDELQLFDYCVDKCIRQRYNDCLEHKMMGPTIEKCEEIMLICIGALFKHWKEVEADDQQILSRMTSWLQPTLSLGYFNCTLVLLEKLHCSGHSRFLLDTVFELHASAIGTQFHDEGGKFRYHREFMVVCIEKLLKYSDTTGSAVASVKSVVHMCVNNYPLKFVKCCFDTVFPDGLTHISRDNSDALENMKMMRVGGKTMVQWVVSHARFDIAEWLLLSHPVGLNRALNWAKFVSALSDSHFTNGIPSNSAPPTSFMDNLFLLYEENIRQHLSPSERENLLTSLVVNNAIPKDSVVLLSRLIDCWGSGTSNKDEKLDIPLALKEACVLHSIARWNALRVAEFCLSRRCSSEVNRVDWQQIFTEESQERHKLDNCTPLERCRLLGNNHLFKVLSLKLQQPSTSESKADTIEEPDERFSEISGDTEEEESPAQWVVGQLRSVLSINEVLVTKNADKEYTVEKFKGYQRCRSVQDPWLSAVVLDQVSHLRTMALTRSSSARSDPSVGSLILTAIKSGSLNALEWIVETNVPLSTLLTEEEGTECLSAAAKHSGDVYAEMTLLLLEDQLHPGRLSGDGMGVPLLHRAACFTNTSLACRIMAMLLERSDCDVNALDAFGNTAISYALAAGCLNNACFLIKHLKCRLEAEYEGQSAFYYVLHILPSFASRTIVRELLQTKRDRAFLHCEGESKTCGCKGYERPREDSDSTHPCGFCGHESICHRLVPLPSWFRDQYDTYVAAGNLPQKRSHSSSDEGDNDSERSQHFPAVSEYDTVGDEEIVLENGRGRLDVRLLKQITELRYDEILHTNGLEIAIASEQMEAEDEETITAWDNSGVTSAQTKLDLEEPQCINEELLPIVAVVDESLQGSPVESVRTSIESLPNKTNRSRKLADYPKWLQRELAMVHSPRCLCQTPAFVINRRQLAHVAVCRWLRRTAIIHFQQQNGLLSSCSSSPRLMESAIVAFASVQPAFEHWRGVVQLAEQVPTNAVPRPSKPLPRRMTSVLFHWQHGKEFLAFQRWKNHQTSAEVTHHRLAMRLEHVAADMRRNRLKTLQLRQQQLQDSTRDLQIGIVTMTRHDTIR